MEFVEVNEQYHMAQWIARKDSNNNNVLLVTQAEFPLIFFFPSDTTHLNMSSNLLERQGNP